MACHAVIIVKIIFEKEIINMGCNTKDVCLSFLYLESLRERGVLVDTNSKMINKMVEHTIDKLSALSQSRDKIMEKKISLEGYPSVNLISKDYGNFLNFEEEYSMPTVDGDIETVFDIRFTKDTSLIVKTDGIATPSNAIRGKTVPRYEDRDNVIVSILNERTVMNFLTSNFRASSEILVFDLDYSPILATLKDFGTEEEFKRNVQEAFLEYYKFEDQELEELSTEAYLPIRINNRVVEGIQIDKERLVMAYLDRVKSFLVGKISDSPINDKEQFIRDFLVHESNMDMFLTLTDKVQEASDREMIFYPNLVAGENLKNAKGNLEFRSDISVKTIEVFREIKKGDLFEIDLINNEKSIQLLPVGKKDEVEIGFVDTFVTIPSENNPAKFIRHELVPDKVTLKVAIGTQKSTALIESFKKTDIQIPKKKERNISKAKPYKIEKDFAKNFDAKVFGEEKGNRRTMIVDEADQGAGGQLGDIISYVFKENASKILVSTGTPVDGYPESSVNILKFGGGMSLEDVKNSMNEFQSLYGVHKIQSEILAIIIRGGLNSSVIRSTLQSSYAAIKEKEKSKNSNINIDQEYKNIFKTLGNALMEENLIDKERAMSIDVDRESVSLKLLFDSMEKTEAKNKNISFTSLIQNALLNTPALTKREPRISSIRGFSNTFFTTAGKHSISSTDAGIRKETIFEDHKKLFENYNKKKPQMDYDLFVENNRSGVRVAQAILKYYASSSFLGERFEFLASNYRGFISMLGAKNKTGENLRKKVLKNISIRDPEFGEITENELYSLMQKTTTSSNDSFENFYKSYLKNNGSVLHLYKKDDAREEKRVALFREVLVVFDSFLKHLPIVHEMKNKNDQDKKKGQEEIPFVFSSPQGVKFDFAGVTYRYSKMYQKGIGGESVLDTEEDILKHLNGMGYPDNAIFSVNLDLCPDDLKEFIYPDENGQRLPYRFELTNKEENQILDVLGSLGIKHKIKQQMLSGANLVNLSQRVFTNSINVLNYLSAFKEIVDDYQNDKLSVAEKHIVKNTLLGNARIIINMTSMGGDRFNLKSVFDNIKNIDGVEFSPTKRNILDGTTKKSVMYDKKAVLLVSHYASVSRGFALDYFHKDIVKEDGSVEKAYSTLNFIDPVGGGNGIQALSRLESPKTDKNLISIYNGGNDGRIMFFGEQANSVLEHIIPTSSNRSANKNEVYGEIASKINAIISLPKESADVLASNFINTLDLGTSFAMAEISHNAKKTQTAVETYNMIMRGEYQALSDEERVRMYGRGEIFDLGKIPEINTEEEIEEENEENVKEEEEFVLSREDQEILSEISSELGIDTPVTEKISHDIPLGYHR